MRMKTLLITGFFILKKFKGEENGKNQQGKIWFI